MSSQIIITDQAPAVIAPINATPQTPQDAAKGHSTVTMEFDKQVLFTVSHGHKVLYTKGTHEVPRQWAGHWYLRANGVRLYSKPIYLGDITEKPVRIPRAKSAKK